MTGIQPRNDPAFIRKMVFPGVLSFSFNIIIYRAITITIFNVCHYRSVNSIRIIFACIQFLLQLSSIKVKRHQFVIQFFRKSFQFIPVQHLHTLSVHNAFLLLSQPDITVFCTKSKPKLHSTSSKASLYFTQNFTQTSLTSPLLPNPAILWYNVGIGMEKQAAKIFLMQ